MGIPSEMTYNRPDAQDIEYFSQITDGAVITPGGDIEPYTHDETEDLRFSPDVVVRPLTEDQVSLILKRCYERTIPVTPRGGGTGLSGGALCVHGGVCLSLDRMNRIIDIDTANLVAVVQPGVVTEELHKAAEALDLMYPPDPASKGSCTIGGNIAECAGGIRAVKYGVTRDYVIGMRAVLADGTPISHGGRLYKNSTGYNLAQLVTGSEGTLAVVTEVTLKLIPRPLFHRTLLAPFDSHDAAVRALNAIFLNRIIPSGAEFMEREAVRRAEVMLEKSFPTPPAEALLLIELDGNDPAIIDREVEKAGEILLDGGALDVLVAAAGAKQTELWDIRRSIGEAVKKFSVYKEQDTVAPRSALPDLIRMLKEISREHNFTTICYGHAGDGNIHANVVKGDMTDEAWRDELPDALMQMHRAVAELGGMVSGEHGIGYTQRKYLTAAIGPAEIALMRAIKYAFDPKGILNPGKIFPDDSVGCPN